MAAGAPTQVRSVPLCSGITLSASYLAETGPAGDFGFRFTLVNGTNHAVKLAEPIPSSSHWYAKVHDRWLWRASNGAGGSLLNAENERGPVLVYPSSTAEVKYVTVPARQTRAWVVTPAENPVVEYKPGCALCSWPGESEYRVVFAYAYLPAGSQEAGLLTCGLRSAPAPMPPKQK